jgi:hypothetical protein
VSRRKPAEGIHIEVKPSQFMRDANRANEQANRLCKALGIKPRPQPYPDEDIARLEAQGQ